MRDCLTVLCICYLSSTFVLAGVVIGDFVADGSDGILRSTIRMDARHYLNIVQYGYTYSDDNRSRVAFFPLYPVTCRIVASLAGDLFYSMLFVSNILFILTLLLCFKYCKSASFSQVIDCTSAVCFWGTCLFAVLPSTFYLRMGYSESMFCFFEILVLYGISNKWPIVLVAAVAGAATAVRPVGIAVSVAVLWYAYHLKMDACQTPIDLRPFWARSLKSMPTYLLVLFLSCSGLLAYIIFLWIEYGEPFAFANTQEHWSYLSPTSYNTWDKIVSLSSLEPIWNVYNPNSLRYWRNADTLDSPLMNCHFWNPIFYLFTWFLIGLGWWKKWLKDYEIVLSIGLLLIPYVTRAYEMSMASHARFAAVVIPQYFVLGRLFAMMTPAIAGCLCGLMGLMLGLWTALFVAGYRFF